MGFIVFALSEYKIDESTPLIVKNCKCNRIVHRKGYNNIIILPILYTDHQNIPYIGPGCHIDYISNRCVLSDFRKPVRSSYASLNSSIARATNFDFC